VTEVNGKPKFDLTEFKLGSRTAKDWLNAVPSTANQRRLVLENLLACTGATREELESAIRQQDFDKVRLTKRLIEHLRKPVHGPKRNAPLAMSTIRQWLSLLISYLMFIDTKFDGKKFLKDNFPTYSGKTTRYVINKARALTRAQVRATLSAAKGPKYKAMIAILISTGARIGEVLALKVENLKLDKIPAIVSFETEDSTTKTHTRESFLSQEAAGLVRTYLELRPINAKSSDWLFPTEEKRKVSGNLKRESFGSLSGHQEDFSARFAVYEAFKNTGDQELLKTVGKGQHAFRPHTFRSTFLAIARAAGYSEDYAKQLCGHDIGTESSYTVTEEMANMWLEKCESAFTFMSGGDAETDARIRRIERDNAFLAGVLRIKMKEENEQRKVAEAMEQYGITIEDLKKFGAMGKLGKQKTEEEIEKELLESGPDGQSLLEDQSDKAEDSQ
jgi:integrase